MFYENNKKVLVLVSQNAIRAKRSIQQQYNNQIIISFLYTTQPFYEQKTLKNTHNLAVSKLLIVYFICIRVFRNCIQKKLFIFWNKTKNSNATKDETRQSKKKKTEPI